MNDFRPGDRPGWIELSPSLKDYERARAGADTHVHVVRPGDLAGLEALLIGDVR